MEIYSEKPININGKDYWTVRQFAKLTNREEHSIRYLIIKGNRIRQLKSLTVGGKPFIEADELFNFPFVTTGRPNPLGINIERYTLEMGKLKVIEGKYNPCQ
jgi:hypothetical protein